MLEHPTQTFALRARRPSMGDIIDPGMQIRIAGSIMPHFRARQNGMDIGEACSIGSALAWSGGVIIYKRLGETLAPLQLNLLKNLVVLALIVPTLALLPGFSWPSLPPMALILTLISGVLGIAIADTFYFRALNALGAARMGIMGNLYSPFVIMLSFAFLSERLTALQGVGFVLVSAGVLLVTRQRAEKHLTPAQLRRGLLYGAGAVLLMAVAIVMVKRVLEGQPLLWVVTLRLVGGVLGLIAIFLWRGESLLPRGVAHVRWRVLFFGAFLGQYVSMVLWLAGYKYTKASIAAILNETSSIFIVLLAWIFLHEGMSARKLLGVACTLSGVACMLIA
jgi:drug/metabolite transporter (DMT)-like permease